MIPARHRGEGIAGRTERLAERRLDRIGSRSRSKRGAPLVPDDADDGVAGVMLAVRLRRVSRTARDHNAGSLARTVAADNGVVIVHRIRVSNHANQRKFLSVGVMRMTSTVIKVFLIRRAACPPIGPFPGGETLHRLGGLFLRHHPPRHMGACRTCWRRCVPRISHWFAASLVDGIPLRYRWRASQSHPDRPDLPGPNSIASSSPAR